jgi:hypothetical protein
MENKTYSELIKDSRRKVDLVKTNPSASDTELLLADSLTSIIEALDAINKKADKAISDIG